MCDMIDGMGTWVILWAAMSIALLALAVAGTMWLVRSLTARDQTSPRPPAADAAQELRRRYAAGEIKREEFLQYKVDLE
jgi:putative membrane protein